MPKVQAPAEANPDLQLTNKLITEYRKVWVEQRNAEGGSQVRFSRLSVIALLQAAAIVAVDIGLNHEQFTNTALANYKEAFKRAPKFGE